MFKFKIIFSRDRNVKKKEKNVVFPIKLKEKEIFLEAQILCNYIDFID